MMFEDIRIFHFQNVLAYFGVDYIGSLDIKALIFKRYNQEKITCGLKQSSLFL
jgi:hypothetical protein